MYMCIQMLAGTCWLNPSLVGTWRKPWSWRLFHPILRHQSLSDRMQVILEILLHREHYFTGLLCCTVMKLGNIHVSYVLFPGIKSNISVSSHSPKYYQLGFDLMIDKHFSQGLIDHNTQHSLHSWVNEAFGSKTNVEMIRNTPEYKDLKNTICNEKVQGVDRSNRRWIMPMFWFLNKLFHLENYVTFRSIGIEIFLCVNMFVPPAPQKGVWSFIKMCILCPT